MKILIIEDEPSLREVMQRFLTKERYVVETATTMHEALFKVSDYDYDCILLDIMLPDGNGLDFMQQLKKMGKQERVIIISAKDSTDDKVAGLELGADDYLAKPFQLVELNARIKSVVRRNLYEGRMLIGLGNVEIDPAVYQVFVAGKELELKRKEYDILAYFITRPGYLVDKDMLVEGVWGDHMDQVDNYDFVYTQIRNLRKKLQEAGATIEIRSVYRFGYKMTVEE